MGPDNDSGSRPGGHFTPEEAGELLNGRRVTFGDLVNELPADPPPEDGSLPASRSSSSGLPMRDVRAERNRDHPADTDLCFERGQYTDRVRLTPADRFAVIAALAGTSPGSLLDLREQAGELARQGVPEEHGHGNVNLAAAFTRLVDYAYIAGQADFSAGNGRGAARDYLLGLAEDRDGKSGDMAHLDVEALERVIAMLEEK